MPSQPGHLVSEQLLLFTLMAQLAVGAVLSTMLVRFPWFRAILLTEKRDWPERLIFAASPANRTGFRPSSRQALEARESGLSRPAIRAAASRASADRR